MTNEKKVIGWWVKSALSLKAMFLGWIGGLVYFVVGLTLIKGRITDFSSIAFWSGVFIILGWIIFVLPAVQLIKDDRHMFAVSRLPFLNAAYGACAFLILCGWMGFWKEPFYIGYGAFVGLCAGLAYALLLKKVRPYNQSLHATSAVGGRA